MKHYIFLIDTSHSMHSKLIKIINGLNEFINTSSTLHSYFSLASFNRKLEWIVKLIEISYVNKIHIRDFKFSGSTCLYDSICDVILYFGINSVYDTYFYIITDGDDNHSNKYTDLDANYLCKTAMNIGNWKIKHLDTIEYSTLDIPRIQYDINSITCMIQNLQVV